MTARKKRGKPDDLDAQMNAIGELFVRVVYNDELEYDDGFFAHVGLASNVSYARFRKHYDRGGQPDTEKLFRDVHSLEPTSKRWKEEFHKSGDSLEKLYKSLLMLRADSEKSRNTTALAICDELLSKFRTDLVKLKH